MSSKTKSKVNERPKDETCVFCLKTTLDTFAFGKMLKYRHSFAHYYCLLLSSGLSQNGRDSEGMFGFLMNDINKEVKRGQKLKCSFCKQKGATIGCSNKSCKKTFHLPCGLNNKTMHHFFGNFNSYCLNHRPKQTLNNSEVNDKCPTCSSGLQFDGGVQVLSTPCCQKLFHRECIQRQALSAGYFFKCALCNNADQFKCEMVEFGIYVPKQDASWEREDNAFGELYQRHSSCDVEICLCTNGRQYNSEVGNWKLLLCNTCGSEGAHMTCALINNENDVWICDNCRRFEERAQKRKQNRTQVVLESDDDNVIDDIIESPSCSTSLNTITSNAMNRNDMYSHKRSRNTNRFSIKSEQIEIDLENEVPKRLRTNNQTETSNKKIQCLLVDIKDLIDCESERLSQNQPIIWTKHEERDVIDIDSSDDECLILN